MKIKLFVTGGTFDKEYNDLDGQLFFKDTHIREILKLGRSRLDLNIETLMLIDSLDMTEEDRKKIAQHMSERGLELEDYHKQYKLKMPLIKLAREIPHVTRGGPIVKFRTTMSELLKAKTTRDMKKGSKNLV